MRGKTSAEFHFNVEIERTLRARLRQARLAKLESDKEQPIVHSKPDSKPKKEPEREAETMGENPPPPERLFGNYGMKNASGGRLTIVNQPVNMPNFQLYPNTINQLEKRPFSGKINEDANKHLQRFLTMSTTLEIEGHTEEENKLRMFSFTLYENVEEWFYSLPTGSITTWEQMETAFLNEYFPASVFLRKRYDIMNFKQKEGESLGDSYKRFKRLLVACMTHNLDQIE